MNYASLYLSVLTRAILIISILIVNTTCRYQDEKNDEPIQFEFESDTTYFLGKWYDPESGTLLKEQEFFEKVPNGYQIIYHENGTVQDSGYFKHGLAHGFRCIYDLKGGVIKKFRYQNDSLKELVTFDDFGRIKTYEFFKYGTERIGLLEFDRWGHIKSRTGKYAQLTKINSRGKAAQIELEIAHPPGYQRKVSMFSLSDWQSIPIELVEPNIHRRANTLIVLPKNNAKNHFALIVQLIKDDHQSSDTLTLN